MLGQRAKLRGPFHCLAWDSRSRSALCWAPKYKCFRRPFASSSSLIPVINDTSLPPNVDRHLQNVADLMPRDRRGAGTGMPASVYSKTAMIWLSMNRDIFMGAPSNQATKLFHFSRPRVPVGDYPLTCSRSSSRYKFSCGHASASS